MRDADLAERGDAGVTGFTLPVRLAIGHSHFEAVHPFPDGNGRVGRALWPLQMVVSGHLPLYLSGYVESEKREYSNALQAAQKKLRYGPIVEFLCAAIIESDREGDVTKEALASLPQQWQARAKFRDKSTAMPALEVLTRFPILTTETLIEELGVSKQAANVALHQLVERGVVRQRRKVGRHVHYAAGELIALLARDFGSRVENACFRGRELLKSPME